MEQNSDVMNPGITNTCYNKPNPEAKTENLPWYKRHHATEVESMIH